MASFVSSKSTLTVLSWNIWFDRLEFALRNENIIRQCLHLNPDVICFQEVTPNMVRDHIMPCSSLLDKYQMSDDGSGNSVAPYGVLMLCKKELNASFTYCDFPTNMCRKLLYSKFNLGRSISLGTVHLESLNSQSYRENQLEICEGEFHSAANAILCGDFNFCSYRNFDLRKPVLENDCLQKIMPDYHDLWPMLHPDDKGYTFDSTVNENITHEEVMRYDRLIFKTGLVPLLGETGAKKKGKVSYLSPVSMNILGMDPIPTPGASVESEEEVESEFSTPKKKAKAIYPSDHFGLLAVFDVAPTVPESKCSVA